MKLYTKTVCPKCMLVKMELENYGIEVETVNIQLHPEEANKLIDAGIMAVPVLEFDGNYITDTNEIVKTVLENQ